MCSDSSDGLDRLDKRELLQETARRVRQNAEALLADAELLFEHGRYARAAAMAVLALEELGKTSLLGMQAVGKAVRHHSAKQRMVATSEIIRAGLNRFNRELEALGFGIRHISELTPAQKKFVDDGGPRNIAEHPELKARSMESSEEMAARPHIRRAFNGEFSRTKEAGFYVDVSTDGMILSEPSQVTKEDAAECISFAREVFSGIYYVAGHGEMSLGK
jgi:AbiV family abortive infection protein